MDAFAPIQLIPTAADAGVAPFSTTPMSMAASRSDESATGAFDAPVDAEHGNNSEVLAWCVIA
jgi:hypothetical protein